MKLNRQQVLNFIPHRNPFLFVDEVESIQLPVGVANPTDIKQLVGGEVVARFHVSPDMEILKGHFPGNPILPGVVQTEMMAQTSIFITHPLFTHPDKVKLEVALLGVDRAKYRKPVRPGMDLRIFSRFTKHRGPMMSFECHIESQGEKISECSILANFRYENKE